MPWGLSDFRPEQFDFLLEKCRTPPCFARRIVVMVM
jgi:hypothetical protein